jgi:hypothetical protein
MMFKFTSLYSNTVRAVICEDWHFTTCEQRLYDHIILLHVNNACMTTSFHYDERCEFIRLDEHRYCTKPGECVWSVEHRYCTKPGECVVYFLFFLWFSYLILYLL